MKVFLSLLTQLRRRRVTNWERLHSRGCVRKKRKKSIPDHFVVSFYWNKEIVHSLRMISTLLEKRRGTSDHIQCKVKPSPMNLNRKQNEWHFKENVLILTFFLSLEIENNWHMMTLNCCCKGYEVGMILYTYVSARTVVVASFYFTEVAIGKEELLGLVVDGQPIRCQHIRTYYYPHVLSSQGGSHDAGPLFIPVGPKHQAGKQKPKCN